ncbi:Hypothetical protein LOCK908_0398 [Lacticaseibacillus rhamnosus LOCK908]|uniref:Uncharacterized protein n=1 Tax=Lacticaseibacillus rhamnosus (strain LMS2-1) TaxID=525361 RepID=C2K0L1_LACRM|nr:conserved hypothetical protein [Lacticaseibacillus rhamnosus ATCC 8530]AGP73082.1 Hypothetical protein LOCK908_0398 [Lacticaseibacillus rhamnosus LOCK908]EEN79037.1 hypothetical protein HMPREF0539_2696 [Lacticaseibacillus rhamnosus LMS2-1]
MTVLPISFGKGSSFCFMDLEREWLIIRFELCGSTYCDKTG